VRDLDVLIHGHTTATAPNRVVLLGATGFLASRLARSLEQAGMCVRAIGSREIDLTEDTAVDTLTPELRDGDTVVFLSALTPEHGRGVDTLMANLRMGEHVCAALVRVRPSHVVYVSSDAVYRESEEFVNENSPADATSLYGSMHALRERMLMHAISGVPLAVLRPTLVFGPGDTHNSYGVNRFMRTAVLDRRIKLFGEGEERRDHVYVVDVVRLMQACIEHQSSGVLNVVTGESISFGDLARQVAAIAGNVAIESQPRASGSILHRQYDATMVSRAFPEFRFTPRDKALAEAWRGYAAGA
jgi:UDP-glucose 4-epimerase